MHPNKGWDLFARQSSILSQIDPTQPVAARVMVAKTALPFMLPKLTVPETGGPIHDDIVRKLQKGRDRAAAIVASS
jgi:hypothetical protein